MKKKIGSRHIFVACGAASRLRLKRFLTFLRHGRVVSRMWSGFSSEIETYRRCWSLLGRSGVACGAASRLRLKHANEKERHNRFTGRMWSGFSSEIETSNLDTFATRKVSSHVERLLV